MLNVLSWLAGKRTYIISLAVIVLSVLEAFDIVVIPTEVWTLLGGAGLATLRMSIKNALQQPNK